MRILIKVKEERNNEKVKQGRCRTVQINLYFGPCRSSRAVPAAAWILDDSDDRQLLPRGRKMTQHKWAPSERKEASSFSFGAHCESRRDRLSERTEWGKKKKREDAGRPPVRPMIVGNGSIYAGRTRQGAGAIFGPGEATCKASPSSRDAAALISPRAANARRRNTSVRPAFSPSTPRRGVVPPVARPQRSWSAVAAFAYMDCTFALYGLGCRTSCSRADETNRG